jgi:hypothetical protein
LIARAGARDLRAMAERAGAFVHAGDGAARASIPRILALL